MNEKTAGEVYKKNIGSVVYVFTRDGYGQVRGQGSGVVVGDNQVVTNCHVIGDGRPVMVARPNADSTDAERIRAKMSAALVEDMCLLKTDGLSAPAVELGETSSVEIGDPVYAIGNPGGFYGVLSSGIVTQMSSSIHTNAAMAGGSSGGGLFDSKGRLIGISRRREGPGESLHSCLPVELVKHLRQRAGVEEPLYDMLTAALKEPSAEKFRKLNFRIVESIDHPLLKGCAWKDIGTREGDRGDKARAAEAIRNMLALAEAHSEFKDQFVTDAAHIMTDAGEMGDALKLAESLGDGAPLKSVEQLGDESARFRLTAFLCIGRELAVRASADPARRAEDARKMFAERIPLVLDAREREKLYELPDELLLSEIACALAAIEDSEHALRIADVMIQQGRDFEICAEMLARIAHHLRQRKVVIGADSVFYFIKHWARKWGPAKNHQRLNALATAAFHAANCEDHDESADCVQKMGEFEKEHGSGGEYTDTLFRNRAVAEVLALGDHDPEKTHAMIARIPVLGNYIVPALAAAAIKLSHLER